MENVRLICLQRPPAWRPLHNLVYNYPVGCIGVLI